MARARRSGRAGTKWLPVVAAAILLTVPGAAHGAGPRALVVLPPGEGGTVTLGAFARNQITGDCADLGPHACDQVATYRDWRFRDGALAPIPGEVRGAVSTEQPEEGLTIVRDGAGVPHIYATGPDEQTIEERVAFGVGYAQAQERLFQMEVLRRAGEGRLSDLLGPDYLQMDLLTRRDTETDAERAQQVAALPVGQRRSLDAYSAGINAVIALDGLNPNLLPAGFSLTQDLPIAPWTANDTVAVLTLEVKGVAESAGNELGYGALARALAQHYGTKRAVRILDDVQFTRDRRAPTTVPHHQRALRTSDRRHYSYIRYRAADTARQISALGSSVVPAHTALLSGAAALAHARSTLGLPVFGSNAWAIAPRRSKTGRALLWGAPQVGYYVPEVFDELEVEGGLSHMHGVGVPGGGPGVAIGYTPHTAWSITTAQDDQVDTFVDRIRRAPGGGLEYWWRGEWHPVTQRTETIRSRTKTPDLPLVGSQAPPVYTESTATFYRTEHGPPGATLPCVVVYLDVSAGVSYCKVRAFWNSELETGRSLVAVNQATGLASFDAAVRQGIAGFNFIYADDAGHIGYWHTGRIPVRAKGMDPRLPAPGDGSADWRGFLPSSRWPSVVDPAQGFVASWNNKPQVTWLDSGDGSLWGRYQRVRQPMALLRGRRRFDLDEAWQVARRTGELDLRATLGFKRFLTRLSRRSDLSPVERAAIAEVARWDGTAFYPGGAERDRSGNATGNVAGAAFPIFSAWFHALEARAAARIFGRALPSRDDAAAALRSFTRTPATTSPEFEFFDDYDAFLYRVMRGWAHGVRYLGRSSVYDVSRAALSDAVTTLTREQGADPTRWRAPMPQISFQALDVAGIPTIPWENRGTWGQAIALP